MSLNDFRSIFLPYYLLRQEDGRYVVLNRESKPVGFATREFVTYEDYPVAVRLKGFGRGKARRLSVHQSEDLDRIYLYDDGCVPTQSKAAMDSYLEKLRILARLMVAQVADRPG